MKTEVSPLIYSAIYSLLEKEGGGSFLVIEGNLKGTWQEFISVLGKFDGLSFENKYYKLAKNLIELKENQLSYCSKLLPKSLEESFIFVAKVLVKELFYTNTLSCSLEHDEVLRASFLFQQQIPTNGFFLLCKELILILANGTDIDTSVIKTMTDKDLSNTSITSLELTNYPDQEDNHRSLENYSNSLDMYLMVKESQRSNSELREFVKILSHDIKGPVHLIRGNANLLVNKIEENEKRNKRFRNINEQALKIDHIVTLGHGYLQNELETPTDKRQFSCREIIDSAILILEKKLENKCSNIVVDLQGSLTINCLNLTYPATALYHVLSNSLKYTTSETKIYITVERIEMNAVILVRDFGIGMSKLVLDNLFCMKTRFSTPGLKGEIGCGMGMPICKKLVESCGGSICAQSWTKDELDTQGRSGTLISLAYPLA